MKVNDSRIQRPAAIAGAPAQSEIAHHCTLKFIWGTNGRSAPFCLAAFAAEARSLQHSNMYDGKSAKMAPTRSGPAFQNIAVALATTKTLANIETRHHHSGGQSVQIAGVFDTIV